MFALEINGDAPDLRGSTCEAFLCEAFEYAGVIEATANVSYLRFQGRWYRLYFDFGIIFWRRIDEAPQPWSVDDEGWVYPHQDVAAEAGVAGVALIDYRMEPTEAGSRVTFDFVNGRRIIVEDTDDRTHYRVVREPI